MKLDDEVPIGIVSYINFSYLLEVMKDFLRCENLFQYT